MAGVLFSSFTVQLVIGVAVPLLVARLQARSLWARYRALQVQHGSKAAPEAASKAASNAARKADSEAASTQGLQAPRVKVDPSVPPAVGSRDGAAAADAATSSVPQVASGNPTPVVTIKARRSLYRPRCNTRAISIKVHHHEAFHDRSAILAAVNERLHTSCSPPTASPPPASPATDPTPTPASAQSITSVAIPGCLQLILSETGLSSPQQEGEGLATQLYDALPAACRTSRVTIQVGLTATHFSPPDCSSSASGSVGAALGDALQRQQQQQVQIEALAVQPLVLQSGLAESQLVEVQLPGSCVGGGLKVVVVAVAGAGGRQVYSLEEVGEAAGTCRLTLPPGLDPGPVALHAASSEGLLLASLCTAALPPPAAQELHQLLRNCTPNSDSDSDGTDDDVRTELEAVLRDLAAVWQLSRSPGGGAVEAGGLIAYFRDNDLGSCKSALEQQLRLALPLQHARGLAPLLRSAAAAARRLVGGCCDWALAGSDQSGAGAAGPAGQPAAGGVGAGQGGSWAQYPSRLGSITAAVVFVGMCAGAWASLQKRKALIGESRPSSPQTAALIMLHSMLMIGPHLWVAVWGPMRARRDTVVVLQTAAKSALYLAPLLWPVMSSEWVSAGHALSQLLVEGVMRPLIKQVSWALQLLITVCELACMATGCRWARPDPATYVARRHAAPSACAGLC